jgi:hypothetical protein
LSRASEAALRGTEMSAVLGFLLLPQERSRKPVGDLGV